MSTFASPARRGLAVRERLPLLPPEIVADILSFLRAADSPPRPNLMRDLDSLLTRPLLGDWSAAQSRPDDARAALVAQFIRTVCDESPALLSAYVRRLLPDIQEIVRSAAPTIRLTHDPEYRSALSGRASLPIVLSSFGPLALFFLRTVARSEWAWEVLLDASSPPPRVQPFGWLPQADGLRSTLRFLLIGQCGRAFRPNALLYSPLARYLIDQGLAQRVHVLRTDCPACQYWGDAPTCPNCGQPLQAAVRPWLLATAYIEQCTFLETPNRRRVILLDDRPILDRPRAEVVNVDLRPADDRLPPPALGELRQMKRLALQAVTRMLDLFRDQDKPRLKPLILWAEAADLDDPSVLLAGPPDPPVADALIEAIIAPEIPDRSARLPRMNRRLVELASRYRQADSQPFTGNQMGANLVRLRRQFMDILQGLVRGGLWA